MQAVVTKKLSTALEKAGLVVRKHEYINQRGMVSSYANYVLYEGTEEENYEDKIVLRVLIKKAKTVKQKLTKNKVHERD